MSKLPHLQLWETALLCLEKKDKVYIPDITIIPRVITFRRSDEFLIFGSHYLARSTAIQFLCDKPDNEFFIYNHNWEVIDEISLDYLKKKINS